MNSSLNCENHCQSCITKNCNTSVNGCRFVTCPNSCGFSMHWCKVADHLEELCDRTMVRCINRELGCTNQMERRYLRDHLVNCPASVVYCSIQCCLPKVDPKTPCVKYGQPVQTRSISPFVPPISPAPPLPDFYRKEVTSTVAEVDPVEACSSHLSGEKPDQFMQQPLTGVLQRNSEQNPCARLVPRANFDTHYRLHSDFLIPLNDSIELRCPLHQIGCPFVTTRMIPYDEQCQILYNPRLNRFAVRYVERPCLSRLYPDKSDGDSHPATDQPVSPSLNTLPTEILSYLGTFLDDVSLLCLSEVSHRFFTIVNPLIRQRMVVTPRWQRVVYPTGFQTSSWKIDRFVWSLPDRTEKIAQWHWASSGAEMAAHLKTCAYNDIVVQDRPFSLTDGTQE